MTNRYNPGRSSYGFTWDDIISAGLATRLDTSAGKLDYNYADKTIDIADSTSIANDDHKIHFGFQVEHHFKLNGECDPHIHWIQSESGVPNWWLRYRFWKNGGEAGAWTSIALDSGVFPYVSGAIMQIHKPVEDIHLSGAVNGSLGVSDFIDIEITRDINNSSSLFAGADPLTGDAQLRSFDMHLQVDSDGSPEEYSKLY